MVSADERTLLASIRNSVAIPRKSQLSRDATDVPLYMRDDDEPAGAVAVIASVVADVERQQIIERRPAQVTSAPCPASATAMA